MRQCLSCARTYFREIGPRCPTCQGPIVEYSHDEVQGMQRCPGHAIDTWGEPDPLDPAVQAMRRRTNPRKPRGALMQSGVLPLPPAELHEGDGEISALPEGYGCAEEVRVPEPGPSAPRASE
jgi:hypothetical protein